ncbi:hypothetical protein [Clostridium sp.]|uniref:hypothetical protein n=1 Tax=Clostridium sp. TaxID=1506 RepID=UPI00283D6B05|nr:hypothetical protein [Clostridium sp.]MDR3596390.1 hypothetical protein [Clostridium sp.]
MAKHKHREQNPIRNDTNTNASTNTNARNNIPFGIDPMQLMGLLGGNFDMNNMGNMLASMNTNGFDLGNLNSIAQMMGLNLDNNLFQGNVNNQNTDTNKNYYPNVNNQNVKKYTNSTSSKTNESSNVDRNSKKNESTGSSKYTKDNDANLEFLVALRNHIHPDRIKLMDKIIEAYKSGEFNDD